MSVFIYQPDALELMGLVEGEEWLQQQKLKTACPYSFPIWLEAWNLKMAAGLDKDDDSPLADFISDRFELSISPVIYGKGGFHRYVVQPNGEILFSKFHSVERRIPAAIAAGFTVY